MYRTLSYNQQYSNPLGEWANSLYRTARQRGQRAQLWARLSGRSRGLLNLGMVHASCSVESQVDAGIRAVPIDQIRGSEGRSADFDCKFNPLQDHTQRRWLAIAEARALGKVLPPVALIKVGDLYFVRDGHHRISVARALGEKAVQAEVVVWQVVGPLPWHREAQSASRNLAHIPEESSALPGVSRFASGLARLSCFNRLAGLRRSPWRGGVQ